MLYFPDTLSFILGVFTKIILVIGHQRIDIEGFDFGNVFQCFLPVFTINKGLGCECVGCPARCPACLLYTSDAADERSSVDLGGRRIIKKTTTR